MIPRQEGKPRMLCLEKMHNQMKSITYEMKPSKSREIYTGCVLMSKSSRSQRPPRWRMRVLNGSGSSMDNSRVGYFDQPLSEESSLLSQTTLNPSLRPKPQRHCCP